MSIPISRKRSIEELIEEQPFGRFHFMILLLSGLATMSDALETNLLAFVSLCAGAQWDLSNVEIASLTSAIFAGEMIGAWFWGPFADRFGRRAGYLGHTAVMTFFGIISGFSPNYGALLFLRMMVGFGVGGCTIPFDLQSEFTPTGVRGAATGSSGFFWLCGALLVSGVAWGVLGPDNSWRTLVFVVSAPVAIALIIGYIWAPESPRWLLIMGREEDAKQEIIKASAFNKTPILGNFELVLAKNDAGSAPPKKYDKRESNDCGQDSGAIKFTSTARTPKVDETPKGLFSEFKAVLHPDRRDITIPAWWVWLTMGFTYYGIVLLVARVYAHTDDDGELECSFEFVKIFINACMEGLGNIIVISTVDRLGRVHLQTLLYSLAAVGVFFMGLKDQGINSGFVFFCASLARGCIAGASGTSWVHAPELYETEFRASGHSTNFFMARIGAMLVPFLVNSNASIAAVGTIIALLAASAAFVVRFLPETNQISLDKGSKGPSVIKNKKDSDILLNEKNAPVTLKHPVKRNQDQDENQTRNPM